MRGFVFKLEGVLEHRRHSEQQRQRDLALVQKQIVSIELEINRAAIVERSSHVPLRGQVNPRMLAAQVRFSQIMRQKLGALRVQLAAARDDLVIAHAALTEASKQRKVLEKLQEKQQARWLVEQQRKESAAHDDIAQQMTRQE